MLRSMSGGDPPTMTSGIMAVGMHLSGTSAVTRVINLLCVPLGWADDICSAKDSPSGHGGEPRAVRSRQRAVRSGQSDLARFRRIRHGHAADASLMAAVTTRRRAPDRDAGRVQQRLPRRAVTVEGAGSAVVGAACTTGRMFLAQNPRALDRRRAAPRRESHEALTPTWLPVARAPV